MSGTSVRTSLSDLISPSCSFLFFFLLIRPPPISTLFPYTTLFRSGLGALVHGDLERPTFVEPVNDVVHVGAAHAGLECLAGGASDQVLGDRFLALQLALVLELVLTCAGGQRSVVVRDEGCYSHLPGGVS